MMNSKDEQECIYDIIAAIADREDGLTTIMEAGISPAALPGRAGFFLAAAIQLHEAGRPVYGAEDDIIAAAAQLTGAEPEAAYREELEKARSMAISPADFPVSVEALAKEYREWKKLDSLVKNTIETKLPLSDGLLFIDAAGGPWEPIEKMKEDVQNDMPFPVDMLPSTIQEMVKAVSVQLQVPEAMPAMFALGVLSAAVGSGCDIQINRDWLEPLNLWAVVSADSSERKTQVRKVMCAPLVELERELREQAKDDIAADALKHERIEARLKTLKGKDAKGQLTPEEEQEYKELHKAFTNHIPVTAPRLVIDDCTPEALVEVLRNNRGCAAMISDEPGIFGRVKSRPDRDSGIEIYLSLFSGTDIRQNRIGRGETFVQNPRLSCLVCSQPDVLIDAIQDRELHGRGFFARWLYADMRALSRVGWRDLNPPEIPEAVKEAYHALIDELYEEPPEQGQQRKTVTFSPEALELFQQYHANNEKGLRPGGHLYRMKAWGGKLTGQTARIAGLLHAAAVGAGFADAPVSGVTMQLAGEISVWLYHQARILFDEAGEETPELYVLNFLRKYGEEEITFKQLQDKTRYKPRREEQVQELLLALWELRCRGYVRLVRHEGKGRPSYKVHLNPAILPHKEDTF